MNTEQLPDLPEPDSVYEMWGQNMDAWGKHKMEAFARAAIAAYRARGEGDAVQWQYRDANDDGTWGAWLGCDKRLAPSQWREVRALYTSPTAPDASQAEQAAMPRKSLNAKAADLLRPFLKPGDKVIWRESFRWFDDNGVLSNHYDSMELESLAADFGYDIDWDTNFKHAAIVRTAMAAAKGDAS